MEQENISFSKGIQRTPSVGEAGELSECVNLLPQHGEMMNIEPPMATGVVLTSPEQNIEQPVSFDDTTGLAASELEISVSKNYIYNLKFTVEYEKGATEAPTLNGAAVEGIVTIGSDYTDTITLATAAGATQELSNVVLTTDALALALKLVVVSPLTTDSFTYKRAYTYLSLYYRLRVEATPVKSIFESNHIKSKELIYVHQRGGEYAYKNYIVKGQREDDTWCMWVNGEDTFLLELEPLSVTSIGNTLCVSTEEGIYYFLWKNKAYKALGCGLPEVYASIVPYIEEDTAFEMPNDVDYGTYYFDNPFDAHTGTYIKNIPADSYNTFMGAINIFEAACNRDNRFIYPFFLVYAVKLYDGTYTKHSSPIMIAPNEDGAPVVMFGGYIDSDNKVPYAYPVVYANRASLAVKISSGTNLSDWKDIISGLSFFVTQQHQRYKEEYTPTEEITLVWYDEVADPSEQLKHNSNYFKGTLGLVADDINGDTLYRQQRTMTRVKPLGADYFTCAEYPIAYKEYTEWIDELEKDTTFFELKSIALENFTEYSGYTKLALKENYLSTLSTQTALTYDTNYSHSNLRANKVMAYNSRLILADILKKETSLFDLSQFSVSSKSIPSLDSRIESINTYVLIEDEEEIWVEINSKDRVQIYGNLYYLFYPNPKAKRIVFVQNYSDGKKKTFSVELKASESLLGAYWFNSMTPLTELADDETVKTSRVYSDSSNVIMVSETDNPFVFKGSSSITLSSRVLNISIVSKALSQGQFGAFPLYAFCEDGIWALEVSSTGTFSAKQPITRDVLIQDDAICQLDNAVAFIANDGVKILSGSNAQVISVPVQGNNFNELAINGHNTALKSLLPSTGGWQSLVPGTDTTPFFHNLAEGGVKMLFDSAHRLLHIFTKKLNVQDRTHYVVNLDTYEWAMQKLELGDEGTDGIVTAIVPGYPLSYLQIEDKIYAYDHLNDSTTLRKGYILTRPCYMGNPLSRKALYDLRMIGQRTTDNSLFRITVLISNDMRNWYRLPSLKMKSAKYYRYLIRTNFTDIDTLTGMAIHYEERYGSKLR